MPVGHVVDLNDRSDRAAAKTGNLLNGELTFRVCILTVPNMQFTAEGLMHQFRTLDVTGCAGADPDDVLPDRGVPELRIESRYACNCRWSDIRNLTNPPQGRFRKIVIFILDGMQNGNNSAGLSADFIDDLVDKRLDAVRFQFHAVLISDAKQIFLSTDIDPIVHEGGDGHGVLPQFILAYETEFPLCFKDIDNS